MNTPTRLLAGIAALALPLSMAVATSASAIPRTTGRDDDDRGRDDVSIRILDARRDGDDAEVKVRYRCEDDERARIEVRLRQGRNSFEGDERVRCNGRGQETWIEVEGDDDIERGRAFVRATIRQGDERDSDSDTVRIGGRDRDRR